jgi:predicted ribosome quality control (RQC) complex YloA/Tae2 family protein
VLEAARGRAGLYLLTRAEADAIAGLAGGEPEGKARHALLLFRKHVDGVRVRELRRPAGERQLLLDCGDVTLSLRLWGVPALTLVVSGHPLATLGAGREAWPPAAGGDHDAAPARATRPALQAAAPLDSLTDAELAPAKSVVVSPEGTASFDSWRDAFARYLELRARGDAFAALLRERKSEAARELKRLRALAGHLERDAAGQEDPDVLRRQAEALLAAPASVAPRATEAELPDPYDPARTLRVTLQPSLDAVANAQRLFEKARRIARGMREVAARKEATHARLAVAEARMRSVDAARRIDELPRAARPRRSKPAVPEAAGERRYLTSRGLQLHVGRGARENQRLTFELARPEDLWFHARDTPGAHVILRDDQGRAGPDDRREAAEVAAFFSDAAGSKAVDVHCARRKHLRPAKGSPGRVLVGHSETLRVAPRDPEGRLRRRS